VADTAAGVVGFQVDTSDRVEVVNESEREEE